MKTVVRYPLKVSDCLEVEMPQGAQIVHLGVTRARPCLFALVDEQNPRVLRRFRLTATGEPIPDLVPDWKFVGSLLLGANDCHLWDLGEVAANERGR